jgi:hypoxanthine phosphoribosyltransferase
MPTLTPVLTKEDIQKMVTEVAKRISEDYEGRELVLVGVLKGAFIFLSDLIRQLTIPVRVDFVRACSYGAETSSSGQIRLTKEIELDIENKDVLIVEDIADTGLTLSYLKDYFKSLGAGSVKICALIDKRERRDTSVTIEYACQVIEKGFLVGYGLDYAEDYRGLPGIYQLQL